MSKLFDLNIQQVLENWTKADALREIIANAIDEQVLSGTKDISIYQDGELWHIRDYGRGIQYYNFAQNENDEKLQATNLIGKFGVGLKDALAVFYRHGCHVEINSKYHRITIQMALKTGFSMKTLHAKFDDPLDPCFEGTDFSITGVSKSDIERAKDMFLIFNDTPLLESTKYGDVYECQDGDKSYIYINGVRVAKEPNFMFSYNITSVNALIRKALNRERSNVGRTAYAGTVKKILKECHSDEVLLSLVNDLQKRMYGENKDETEWVDVATYAAKTLNENGNVVFMTPWGKSSLTAQQVEILEQSGKKLIMVTDDVYGKIQSSVETFNTVYKEYNNSFQYEYVEYQDLSTDEQRVFDLKDKIIAYLAPPFNICSNIRVSNTIRVNEYGDNTDGVHESWSGTIIIKRSVLSNAQRFCGVLAHELCHYQHNYEDNSRAFENDLTNMLGYSIYQAIIRE